MNIYEMVTLETIKSIKNKKDLKLTEIQEVWKESFKGLDATDSTIKKGCPRLTFIGLCENNLINGISVKNSYKESVNKNYGISAVKVLKENKDREYTPKELWDAIGNKDKSYNYQMHVVLILWDKKLIA